MSQLPGDDDELKPSETEQQQVFEELAGALRLQSPNAARRAALRARVLAEAQFAQAPSGTSTVRAELASWISLGPKVEMKILRRDVATNMQSVLLRVAAGGMIPGHRHTLEEEFIILEGECSIGKHLLGVGDAHVAAPGSWHEDITTQTGALVFVRGEMRTAPPAPALPNY